VLIEELDLTADELEEFVGFSFSHISDVDRLATAAQVRLPSTR
jgi:hypothetical protein